jgi:hypothetical protein
MRRERTDFERLTDNALLLTLYARAQETAQSEAAGDRLKLMKLAFLSAYDLFRDNIKAFNLRFYRFKRGPYTGQVADSWADLTRSRLLVEDELFTVTEEGFRFAESFAAEVLSLEANRPVREVIDRISTEYAPLDTPALLQRVYDMRCYTLDSPGRKRTVQSVPLHQEFTTILEEDEADGALHIPPGWQVTLELTFHPDALRNLQRGVEGAQEGRLYGLEALGSDV